MSDWEYFQWNLIEFDNQHFKKGYLNLTLKNNVFSITKKDNTLLKTEKDYNVI